jgi:hypothetical protein
MALTIEPEVYAPSLDEQGNFFDKVPSTQNPLRCPCGSRKDKTYLRNNFATHCKSKCHKDWLNQLNCNKVNFVTENETLKATIHNQQIQLVQLETKLQQKNLTIDCLTEQISRLSVATRGEPLFDFINE